MTRVNTLFDARRRPRRVPAAVATAAALAAAALAAAALTTIGAYGVATASTTASLTPAGGKRPIVVATAERDDWPWRRVTLTGTADDWPW